MMVKCFARETFFVQAIEIIESENLPTDRFRSFNPSFAHFRLRRERGAPWPAANA
jgi:hypothetical protein